MLTNISIQTTNHLFLKSLTNSYQHCIICQLILHVLLCVYGSCMIQIHSIQIVDEIVCLHRALNQFARQEKFIFDKSSICMCVEREREKIMSLLTTDNSTPVDQPSNNRCLMEQFIKWHNFLFYVKSILILLLKYNLKVLCLYLTLHYVTVVRTTFEFTNFGIYPGFFLTWSFTSFIFSLFLGNSGFSDKVKYGCHMIIHNTLRGYIIIQVYVCNHTCENGN